jgi:hypothetical protein
MSFDLGDYVDVRHRLELALLKFPDLRVVENEPVLVHMGERVYIQCGVTVYRDHEDSQPMRAYCWEVWPGRTPYTKDSEQMNGATSALGRALGYMGFGIKSGLASADEVRTAQGNSHPSTEPKRQYLPSLAAHDVPQKRQPTGSALTGLATAKQLDLIRDMRRERDLEPWEHEGKTYAEASEEITRLKGIPRNG